MTLYDYRCRDCHEIFEERHSMDFKGVVKCPVCEGGNTQKLIMMPATVLNWKSFLGTDYTPQEHLKRRFKGSVTKEKHYEQSAVC